MRFRMSGRGTRLIVEVEVENMGEKVILKEVLYWSEEKLNYIPYPLTHAEFLEVVLEALTIHANTQNQKT